MKQKIRQTKVAIRKAMYFLRYEMWRIPLKDLSPRKTFLIKHLRILVLALRGFREDKVMLRAPALTYYSMFSIVPIVALAFGIAKGFGLEMYVERQLQTALAGRQEVYDWVMNITESFLQDARGGTMATVGLGILIYTITMLLINIEESFNQIWQVTKPRSWSRKFSDYFSMMFIAPLFLIAASAATVYLNTQVQEANGMILDPILVFIVNIIPYLLLWSVFTLLYMVMPNTNVKFSAALVAGIIAGTVFQLIQWGYIAFQIGAAKYGAIYGSFAALPLLLLWMQVSWMVVLLGAELSFAYQHVNNYEFESEIKNIRPYNRKILSLYVLRLLISNFMKGDKPLTPDEISGILHMPNSLTRSLLNELQEVRLVNETESRYSKASAYQPALDIHAISIKMVVERLDKKGMDVMIAKPSSTLDSLKKALAEFYKQIETSKENKLLKEL